jgi:hypothetical protein
MLSVIHAPHFGAHVAVSLFVIICCKISRIRPTPARMGPEIARPHDFATIAMYRFGRANIPLFYISPFGELCGGFCREGPVRLLDHCNPPYTQISGSTFKRSGGSAL